MCENARRLRRERSAHRVLRSKGKAVATRKPAYRRGGDTVSADGRTRVGYVVFVVGLNKAQRKAWRHFLRAQGVAWVPCQFTRDVPSGCAVRKLRDDTLASAFLCWGERAAFRAVFAHRFVTGIERPGTVGHRLTAKLGPPKRAPRVRKRAKPDTRHGPDRPSALPVPGSYADTDAMGELRGTLRPGDPRYGT